MNYISVAETSVKWGISERSVRNYCNIGRVDGAVLVGKTWNIPSNAKKPERSNKKIAKRDLLSVLQYEKKAKHTGGIYHKVQIDLTYNSNHIEGSKLTHDQTRYIYETNTIGLENTTVNVDDIVETANHFKCIDIVIDSANLDLRENFIKKLHLTLKSGTSDSRLDWFAVGEYKKLPNEVGGRETTLPEEVTEKMRKLIDTYNAKKTVSFEDIVEFHQNFESIHPFQDGNGRIGRLIIFKECLKNNIVPFIIKDSMKMLYYRGLSEWSNEKGYLIDTCLSMQDEFKKVLDYFKIEYEK